MTILVTRVILCYIEGLPDGQRFIRVARQVAKKKPIVAIKSGVTQAGARAVSSHTGSLAGSEQAYTAAFRQAGVLRANSLEDMFDYARGFAYLPPLLGDRIAVVTNAGGPGILATDALERAGMSLARLDPENIRSLKAGLPDAASAANPVDVLGDARSDRYRFAVEKVIADPNVDALIVILTPQAMTEIAATAEMVIEVARKATIPVIACFMGESRVLGRLQPAAGRQRPQLPLPRTRRHGPQGDEHLPQATRPSPSRPTRPSRWTNRQSARYSTACWPRAA